MAVIVYPRFPSFAIIFIKSCVNDDFLFCPFSGGGGSSIVSTAVAEESCAVQHIGPHLVNKQMVLPFIPPKFPSIVNNSNALIKPSEYLRSINSTIKPAVVQCQPVDQATPTAQESMVSCILIYSINNIKVRLNLPITKWQSRKTRFSSFFFFKHFQIFCM